MNVQSSSWERDVTLQDTQNIFVCWAMQDLTWFWLSRVCRYHIATVIIVCYGSSKVAQLLWCLPIFNMWLHIYKIIAFLHATKTCPIWPHVPSSSHKNSALHARPLFCHMNVWPARLFQVLMHHLVSCWVLEHSSWCSFVEICIYFVAYFYVAIV